LKLKPADARIQLEQSEKMIDALKAAHKDVQSLKLNKEGHLITRWPSNLKMYRQTEDFLAGCLGGRSSGFDYYELGAWAFWVGLRLISFAPCRRCMQEVEKRWRPLYLLCPIFGRRHTRHGQFPQVAAVQ